MKRLAAALEYKVPPPLIGALCALLMWLICGMPPLTGRPPLLLVPALALVVLGLTVDAVGVLSFRRARTTVNPFAPRTHRKHCLLRNIPFKPQPHVLGYGLHTYRVGGVAVAGAGCARGGAFRCLDNAFSDYSRRAGSHPEIRYRIPAVPPAGAALGIAQHLPKLCMAGLRTYILPTETLNGSGTHYRMCVFSGPRRQSR